MPSLVVPVTLFDVALPTLAYPLGVLPTILLFIIVVLVEALVLLALRWGGYRVALWDSLVVNGLSTIVGAILMVAVTTATRLESTAVVPLFFGALLLSIVAEALALWLVRQRGAGRTLLATLLMNLASYLLVLLPLTIWLLSRGRFDGY